MNEQLKRRLVGAIVLISLAVIFIPMLLDQNDPTSLPHFGSTVPARPDTPYEPIEIPLALPPEVAPEAAEVVERSIEEAEAADAAQTAAEAEAKPAAPVVAEEPMPAAPAPVKAAEPAKPAVNPRKDSEALAWTVQVGSFDREANAAGLREKLRGLGFPAYVEKVKVEGKLVFRVRVGPESLKRQAEALQGRLQEKANLEGIVVRHPS